MTATRVRKSRRVGCCASCGGWMPIGTRVAKVDGTWMHLHCAVKAALLDPLDPFLTLSPTGR